VALGGDCPGDLALLRAQQPAFGTVASDPTVSRLIDRLAADSDAALTAIRSARAQARQRVWDRAGIPLQEGLVTLDLDATLVSAHSEKEWADKTFKKGSGFHPLLGFIDHGAGGTGEPVGGLLRAGNAGSNTTTDHLTVLEQSLHQLPEPVRRRDDQGRRAILVRIDAAGATHGFLRAVAGHGMQFSIGAALGHFDRAGILNGLPTARWSRAYDAHGIERDGAWVAEATDVADLSAYPTGTRLILHIERPHPGAQLRITDADGLRVTGVLTNSTGEQLAELELRHRHRARCEDRIRAAKDTGLANLPFHDAAQNQIWLEVCALTAELLAWTQRLALTGWARTAEPKRLRLFDAAARLITTARRRILKIDPHWPRGHSHHRRTPAIVLLRRRISGPSLPLRPEPRSTPQNQPSGQHNTSHSAQPPEKINKQAQHDHPPKS